MASMTRSGKIEYMYSNIHLLSTPEDRIEFAKVVAKPDGTAPDFARDKNFTNVELITAAMTDRNVDMLFAHLVRKLANMDKIRDKTIKP
jgi:hypothetical protein